MARKLPTQSVLVSPHKTVHVWMGPQKNAAFSSTRPRRIGHAYVVAVHTDGSQRLLVRAVYVITGEPGRGMIITVPIFHSL